MWLKLHDFDVKDIEDEILNNIEIQNMSFQNCLMLILMSRIKYILLFKKIFWATCQNIQLIIDLVKIINNMIVEFKQKLTSTSLMMTQLFSWHEILKIFMICDHFDKVNKVFELWSSFLKSANNDHEFFIVDLIITLNWIMLLWKVSDWMKNLILIILRKNVFEYIVWSIDFYHNLVIWIIVTKNNFKSVECNLIFLKSDKEYIFSDEMSERDSYSTIVIIIIIINSYILVTSIRSTHEKLYAICIEWTKLFEIENHSQSTRLLHAVKTVSFETMYQICSRWLHVRKRVF